MYAVVKTTSCKRPFNVCILGGQGWTVHVQGPSQTSEQDEASFKHRRREPQGGSGGMPPPQKILESRGSKMFL